MGGGGYLHQLNTGIKIYEYLSLDYKLGFDDCILR